MQNLRSAFIGKMETADLRTIEVAVRNRDDVDILHDFQGDANLPLYRYSYCQAIVMIFV
jgi:uncharacterized protein (UPF0147 family)